jgi:hypothetical protein
MDESLQWSMPVAAAPNVDCNYVHHYSVSSNASCNFVKANEDCQHAGGVVNYIQESLIAFRNTPF